jgi:hypothetical protein
MDLSISSFNVYVNSNASGGNHPVGQGASGVNAVRGSDPDGDGDGGAGRVRHGGHTHGGGGGGGGAVGAALVQALQSLGLSTGGAPTGSDTTTRALTDSSSGAPSTGTADPSKVRQDLHQFMHALIQAVQGDASTSSAGGSDSSTSSASAPASPADRKASFAGGLSALITQVGNGAAPAGLQSAFGTLAQDLQGGGAAAGGTPDGGTSGATSGGATLQQLLTQLQQNLGYGSSAGATAAGSLLSTTA